MSIFTKERERVEKLLYVKNMKDEMNFYLGSNKNTPDIMLRDVPIFDQSSKKLGFYVHALEEEMKKIEAFKRELPHCMHLLRDAIERLKEESGREMGEELEFAVMRNYGEGEARAKASNDITEKKNWMSSVQLYTPVSRNQDSVFHLTGGFFEEGEGSGGGNHSGRKFGGAFSPFKKTSDELKEKQGTAPIDDGLSLAVPEAEVGTNDLTVNGFRRAKLEQPQQQEQQKKHRRCWSPELHKIFVDALHQLGGAQTATPKQIRELMRVDGLTNDEVKSHLQKYRIHIKKVDSAGASQLAVSGSPQGPLQGSKAAKGGSAATGGDSIDDEDDGRSESNGWKGKLQKPFL